MKITQNFNSKVGMRIREARKVLNMSMEELAKKTDISTDFLTAVENGNKGITAKAIRKICATASIPAEYLIFGEKV